MMVQVVGSLLYVCNISQLHSFTKYCYGQYLFHTAMNTAMNRQRKGKQVNYFPYTFLKLFIANNAFPWAWSRRLMAKSLPCMCQDPIRVPVCIPEALLPI